MPAAVFLWVARRNCSSRLSGSQHAVSLPCRPTQVSSASLSTPTSGCRCTTRRWCWPTEARSARRPLHTSSPSLTTPISSCWLVSDSICLSGIVPQISLKGYSVSVIWGGYFKAFMVLMYTSYCVLYYLHTIVSSILIKYTPALSEVLWRFVCLFVCCLLKSSWQHGLVNIKLTWLHFILSVLFIKF